MKSFLAAWGALPLGTFEGHYEGRRYSVTRTERQGGRQAWLWAEDLSGPDRISANLYRLASGALLKPCEMTEEKVINFVTQITLIKPAKE